MGLRAVCRSKGVTTDAASAWVLKAAEHVNEVTVYLERDMHVSQCQIDEFWSYIFKLDSRKFSIGFSRSVWHIRQR